MKSVITIATGMALSFSAFAQKHWEMIEQGNHTVQEIQQEANKYFENKYKGKGSGWKQYKRWEYFALKDADKNGKVDWRKNAFNEIRKFKKKSKRSGSTLTQRGQSLWTEIGPTKRNPTSSWNPGVGRVECISVDPNNNQHILAGAPSGGTWVSKDGGSTWTPLTDKLSTMNMLGCLISPANSDVYFIGTDQGIFKSTDAGASWNSVLSSSIIRIKADPSDPTHMLACGSSGIYTSTNSGDSWSTVQSGNFLDLEFHPTNSDYVYAAGRNNFFRSTNNGANWTQISAGAGSGYGRIAVCPAEPNSVWYAQCSGSNYQSLSKSTNNGQSFSIINQSSTDYFEGYGWYGIDLAVSAQDPNRIYMGGMELYRSTNGGTSFSLYVPWLYSSAGSKYIHADIHTLEWFGSNLYTGTDGGISISQNSEASFKNISDGLNTRQFYKIGVAKSNPNVVVAGAQDNGTASTFGSNYEWREWLGADGMEAYVSWDNPNNQVGTSQNGSLYKTTNGGQSYSSFSSGSGNWVTPVEQDPSNADVFYVGYSAITKYTFSTGAQQTLGSPSGSGNCDELKIAESNSQVMYAAKGSTLSKSTNGGTSWNQLTTSLGSINYISIHPDDPDYVAVATSGSGKIYVSTNGGSTFNSQKLNLPNLSALCVALEKGPKNGMYVGMYSGVYYINDDMTEYIDYQDNLPNVRVNEIEINYIDNRIYAGTYGRGVWSAPTQATSNQIDASISAATSTTFCSGSDVQINAAQNPDYYYQWLESGSEINGATNSSITVNSSGSYSVEITKDGETVESDAIDVVVNAVASDPSVQDQIFCNAGELVTFTAQSPTGAIKWYDSNSANTPIHTGDSYAVNLNQTTSYFVEQSSVQITETYGGALDNTLSTGANHAGGYGLEFDVFKDMTLKSVEVYATGAGDRNFVLKDGNGTIVEDLTISLTDGKNTVSLDWDIEQGSDYIISCEKIGGADVNLFRNDNFTDFPFQISDIMTITNGTAAGFETQYYYYFYNWLIEEDQVDCPSSRVEVTGTLDLCVGVDDLASIGVNVYPNPTADFLNYNNFERKEEGSWNIVDLTGKQILSGTLKASESINIQNYASGLYLFNVTIGDQIYSKEIQKK